MTDDVCIYNAKIEELNRKYEKLLEQQEPGENKERELLAMKEKEIKLIPYRAVPLSNHN